jgi:hypothetical protein
MNKTVCTAFIIAVFTILLFSCNKEEEKIDFITFEELQLNDNGFWNGSDGSGGFTTGNAFFPNTYTDWGGGIFSWMGFGYSNHTDRITPGYENQYSCYAGSGVNNSSVFGLISAGDTMVFNIPEKVEYMYVSNSTYAALSMKNGDQFAKKFGGEDGNDPDFFNLILSAMNDEGFWIGKATIGLADYTDPDNSQDYISNAWTKIPMEDFGYLTKIAFSFESSDSSVYGINTPAYACIDNIKGILKE